MLLTAVNVYGGIAISRVIDGRARTPVAAGVAGLVGTMLGMYTVFFGFVYARLFVILLGLTVTMCQMVFERTSPVAGRDLPSPPGPRASRPPARARRRALATLPR